MRLALRQGMRQLALGVALGLAAAFGVTRVLQSLLMRISPTDPATFTAISILLCAIGTLACWIPARRATLIDPVVALRNE
jgi:ABC-type lipoprotein release transport system permease subunit